MAKVFVYGTLRQGMYNYDIYLKDQATYCGHGYIKGGLMTIIGKIYHAYLYGGQDMIFGEVYDVNDQTLAHLDELESYFGEDCRNNEYNKIYMDILDNDGKVKDQAYVYEFNMDNPMNVNLLGKDILEHDYVQYMQKKKLNSQNLFDDEDMFY